MPKIIAITNQKGGCGKTTTAINLAASIAATNRYTLLIDLDPQSHASFGMGVRNVSSDHSIYNVLTNRSERKKNIESIIRPVYENLDVVAAHILLSTIEQEYADCDDAVDSLERKLSNLRYSYDAIVIDCPPSLGFLTFNALRASDLVIVPADLGVFSLMGVEKLISMVELIRVKMQHNPKIMALPTMVDLRSNFAKNMMDSVKDAFKENIFESHICMNVACREAQLKGIPLRNHKPTSRAALNYDSLAQEIINMLKLPEPAASQTQERAQESPVLRDVVLEARDAKDVYIVGDFNDWVADEKSRLQAFDGGRWQTKLNLKSGRYRYRFIVDGNWTADPSNANTEPNIYGSVDSVLEI
jgi:chromosome partitioning protein